MSHPAETHHTEKAAESVCAYVGIGSNIGDRERYLREAVRRLSAHPRVLDAEGSRIYETEPVGVVDQAAFLNMAVRLRTTLPPAELLRLLLDTERDLGRVRDRRWGPRTLDLDLLLYGNRRIQTEALEIPHPRMWERAFVLIPLAEVVLPDDPRLASIRQHLETLVGKEGVKLWTNEQWPNASGPFAN